MERGSKKSIIIRAFVVLPLIHGTYLCPSDQIYHTVTKSCCYPVFNCRPGNGVVFCAINGTNDTCSPCPVGEIQPQLVSSLDGFINSTCFRDDTQNECASDELMPARNRSLCEFQCLCNNDNCYYGIDPCRCKLKEPRGCEVDMTMDKYTGECVKCPKYTFKNNTGCGMCYYNETEWFNAHRKGISAMFTSIGVTDRNKENISRAAETRSGMIFPITAVIAIIASVVFGILLILACIFHKRLKTWLLICRQRQQRSDVDDPESETPVMEVRPVLQNFNGTQNAQSDGPSPDENSCQRVEPERDQTYVKEVVVGRMYNEEEEQHNMSTEINMVLCSPLHGQPSQQSYGFEFLEDQRTECVEDANDNIASGEANILLESFIEQREEEEENEKKEYVSLIN